MPPLRERRNGLRPLLFLRRRRQVVSFHLLGRPQGGRKMEIICSFCAELIHIWQALHDVRGEFFHLQSLSCGVVRCKRTKAPPSFYKLEAEAIERRSKVNNCALCHNMFIGDIPGLNQKPITFFEDECEVFIVHESCHDRIVAEVNALRTEQKKQRYYNQLLKKLSN